MSDRYPGFSALWLNGRPVDRWHRDADQVRAHVALVESKIRELDAYIESLRAIEFGNVTGPRFAKRFASNRAVLERVKSRDVMFAEALDELEAREANRAD